jgi:glycosyltransferase involved in cell wall biosynthesis
MKVLHVHSGNLFGGIETTMVLQARNPQLFPFIDLHFALCFEGRLSRELGLTNARVHNLRKVRVRYPATIWRARRRLERLIGQEHFDAIITHSGWSHAIFGPVVRSAKIPLVIWIHGLVSVRKWLDRWAFKTQPDLVLCNSKFVRQSLTAQLNHPQGHVFYNPQVVYVPLTNTTDGDVRRREERSRLRTELKTPLHSTVIVQVSRMEPWKGHELHLRALALLKKEPNWVCWLVGGVQRPTEAKYFRKLISLALDLGIYERVCFLGERTDVGSLLNAADIHCQPNTGPEPFGNTFIEALLHKLPVVTTAIGGGKEIVNKSCGILVPPNDPEQLAAALYALIQNPSKREALGSAGPIRAQQLCDLRTQMMRLYDLLSPLVHRPSGADQLPSVKLEGVRG